jgi:PAS domain S-box-containing protein
MPEGLGTSLIQDYAIYAASISTILGALLLIYKKVVKPVYKHFTEWYDMIEKIDKIFIELTPNGGTSTKDKIIRIDTNLTLVGERLRAYLTDTEIAHFETDMNGYCTSVNRTYTRLVERESSEILGHGWHNCVYQKDRDYVIKAWERAVLENRELSISFRFETPSGKLIPIRASSYKMTDSKGETIGYLGKIKLKDEPN